MNYRRRHPTGHRVAWIAGEIIRRGQVNDLQPPRLHAQGKTCIDARRLDREPPQENDEVRRRNFARPIPSEEGISDGRSLRPRQYVDDKTVRRRLFRCRCSSAHRRRRRHEYLVTTCAARSSRFMNPFTGGMLWVAARRFGARYQSMTTLGDIRRCNAARIGFAAAIIGTSRWPVGGRAYTSCMRQRAKQESWQHDERDKALAINHRQPLQRA